jgi:hypothetical protein
MEKLLYLVTKSPGQSAESFSADLRGRLAEKLVANGAHKIQVNVVDAAVAPAAHLRQIRTSSPFDGFVAFWIDSAFHHKTFEPLLAEHVARFAGYAVAESERLTNKAQLGERTPGFSQVCTLQIPPRLTRAAWFDYWQQTHGTLAIETQDTFRYVQNIVTRRLTWDAPPIAGIIEECFPAGAMTDPHVFYDAINADGTPNAERLALNSQRMMDSCTKFIDFDKMEVLITSEYVLTNS